MYILNSPILGKILRGSGLKLTEDGLFKIIKGGGHTYDIPLTSDINQIVELIGMTADQFNGKTPEEVFELLIDCDFFNPAIFARDKEESSKDLEAIRQWLLKNPQHIKDTGRVPIRTVRLEEVPDCELKDEFQQTQYVLENFNKSKKDKFNAMKKIIIADGYDPRNFSGDLTKFYESFGSDIQIMYFYVLSPVELVVEKYMAAINEPVIIED